MELRRGCGPSISEVVSEPCGVCLQTLTWQVFRHKVSRVGRARDLDETNLLSQLHFLQPKSADVEMSDSAHASPLEDTQRCGCIYMQSSVEHQPKVSSKRHATKGFGRSTYNRQQFGLGTALGNSILGLGPRANAMSP